MELSENEEVAKKFCLKLFSKGLSVPCDSSFNNDMFKLPKFYDDVKFKRGQKFSMENAFQMLASNIYGLINQISDPLFAKFLDTTGNSSTFAAARKRYSQTVLHFVSWFTEDLIPGSKSWESLKRVRKIHLAISNASLSRNGYGISQMFMVSTVFVFSGYMISKPHLLGIKCDCDEDRQGFIHMWAVIASMLGIKDEFNMCLYPLRVFENICHIFRRYYFIPLLQIENKTFEKLGRAFTEGLKVYLPYQTYESRLFLTRRLAGIPGYQFDLDLRKEVSSRQVFTKEELQSIKTAFKNAKGFEKHSEIVFGEKVALISKRGTLISREYDLFELSNPKELHMLKINDEDLENYYNDHKFYQLSRYDQLLVKFMINIEAYSLIRIITRFFMTVALIIMKIFFK